MRGHSRRAAHALATLAEEDPALGVLALWCTHRDDEGPGDASVWTRGETILYGAGFEAVPRHQQIGLAAHHILHVAFRHGPRSAALFRRFGPAFDRDVFNIAADAIVNETLVRAGYALPRPCVTLDRLVEDMSIDLGPGPPLLNRLDAETLYISLLHDRRSGGASDDPASRAERVSEAARASGYVRDFDESTADIGAEPEPSGETADWTQQVARAFEEGRRSGRGVGALGFRLADLPRPRTPWEERLRALVSRAVLHAPELSYRRPARRWLAMDAEAQRAGGPVPAFQPSVRNDRMRPRIAIGVDTSSSIDETRLQHFAGQVVAIARRTGAECHLLTFDDGVQSQHRLGERDWESQIASIAFSRGGGTSFDGVLAAADALVPSVIVMLTDLEGPRPATPPKAPVVWAVPGADLPQPPFGRVVTLAS